MFVDSELIDIRVYYRKTQNGKKSDYDGYTEKEFEELKSAGEKEAIKDLACLKIKMKELTWGLHNRIQEAGIIENDNGERHWDYGLFKEKRLELLINSWDAVDKDGKPVAPTVNNIRMLAPEIGEAISRAYEEGAYLSEEEEGN